MTSALMAALLSVMVLPLTNNIAYAQEPTLQQIFDGYFGSNVVNASLDTGLEIFPAGNYTFTIIANHTSWQNFFGWYPLHDPSQLHPLISKDNIGATTTMQIPVKFGLYLDSLTEFNEHRIIRSQIPLTPDLFYHFRTFDAPNGGTVVSAEDDVGSSALRRGDDWNDGVLLMVPSNATTTKPSGPQLTINSVNLSGSPLNGVWSTIRTTDGTLLKSGFTPLKFNGDAGSSYKVSVSNYDGRAFVHWEDNSTSKTRTIDLSSSNTTLTGAFDIGDTIRGFTPLTYTGTEEHPSLRVNATSLDGSKTLRMWTIIDPQFTNSSGTTYKIYASNYQDRVFDHWNDGSTDRVRTLTIGGNATITAYYHTAPVMTTANQTVWFVQKTIIGIRDGFSLPLGIDANFTYSSSFTESGTRLGFYATSTDSTIAGIFGYSSDLLHGLGVKGQITSATINSTDFKLEGAVDPGSSPGSGKVGIEGSCGKDVLVEYSTTEGAGLFRGDVYCKSQ